MNAVCVPGGKLSFLSVQQLMSCSPDRKGCKGGSASSVRRALTGDGVAKENLVPYACSKAGTCQEAPWGGSCVAKLWPKRPFHHLEYQTVRGEKAMLDALVQGKACYVSFALYESFYHYNGGIYTG